MSCDICAGHFQGHTKPICVACAQAALYAPRLQHVLESLEKEKAHTHLEAIVRPGNDGVLAALSEDVDYDTIASGVQKLGVDRKRGQIGTSQQRITVITEQAADLRRQMEDYRDRIASRKEHHEQRRRDVAIEKRALSERQRSVAETISAGVRNVTKNLDKARRRTMEARACLCREAALLCGLERRKHVSRDGTAEDEYTIGGNPIADLRKLNSLPYDAVSASLDNVCRLLCLCSHYLSVRLPAEIMLPHNTRTHPVVLPADKSYRSGDVNSHATGSSQTTSPSASSTLDQHQQPRPRPLCLDRPLPKLAKEDAKAYGLFVEGVMLLAWNVAWLCRSQGLESINTFDDVCAMGRNLYQLLLGSATVTRPRLDRNTSTTTNVTSRGVGPASIQSGALLGAFSHASTYRSLVSAERAAFMHGWRLSSSQRLVDKLRMYLRADSSGAEWEVLDEGEWDEDQEDDKAVIVGGSRRSMDAAHPGMSMMTVAHDDGLGDIVHSPSQPDSKGASGWTRLRGRGVEP